MCKRVELCVRQSSLYIYDTIFVQLFYICRYGTYLDVHCSVVESMITQSPLFHGPRMVEQLTFFSVQILFLRYIHFMILNLFIAKQWKDVWPNLRSNCLIWKSQRYWLVIWCQNYVHEKLNYNFFRWTVCRWLLQYFTFVWYSWGKCLKCSAFDYSMLCVKLLFGKIVG